MNKSVLIIAGEVSGDLHAAQVVRAVKARSPETVFWGIGGDDLRAPRAPSCCSIPTRWA